MTSLFLLATIAISSATNKQYDDDDEGGILIVRMIEVQKGAGCAGGGNDSNIYIVMPNGDTEKHVIDKFNYKTALDNLKIKS